MGNSKDSRHAANANHPSGRCKPPKWKMQTILSGRCKPPKAQDASHPSGGCKRLGFLVSCFLGSLVSWFLGVFVSWFFGNLWIPCSRFSEKSMSCFLEDIDANVQDFQESVRQIVGIFGTCISKVLEHFDFRKFEIPQHNCENSLVFVLGYLQYPGVSKDK